MNSKLSSTISLARRAGAVVYGFDAVIAAAKKRTVKLILTAADLSPKTLKELRYYLKDVDIKILLTPLCMDEVAVHMGKRTGILGITDPEFAKKAEGICPPIAPETTHEEECI